MNRILKSLLIIVLTFTFVITTVSAKKETKDETLAQNTETKKSKVNLYLFRRAGCPHCQDELVYLDKIINKYNKKINIVVYDVTAGGNSQLISDVANTLKYQINGVPFTLIGTQYLEGFGQGLEDKLEKLIEDGYEKQEDDIVESLLDENIYSNLVKTDLYDAMKEEKLEITSKKSKQNNVIPFLVFGSIIIGLGALIYYSRRK